MKSTFCWVVANVGHYHHARIRAFAARRPGSVVVYSVSDTSGFREFDLRNDVDLPYRHVTLFRGMYSRDIAPGELRRAISRSLDDEKPSVVAIQGWSHEYGLAVLDWAMRRKVPRIVFSESQASDFRRTRFRETLKRRIIRQFQSGLVGGTQHADYLTQLGMPADRIFMGYDAIDNEHFSTGAEAARDHGRPANLPRRYFLTSCRFIPKKNLLTLLEAFALFRKRAGGDGENWSLVILGDGTQRPELEAATARLGLHEAVSMPGFISYGELPNYYAFAEAFVLASVTEQWGLVVNEAMASGLPVLVSSRCGCAADLVEPGRNGDIFQPDQPSEIADHLLRMSTSPSRAEMGKHSMEIIARWSPERFADGLTAAVEVAEKWSGGTSSWIDRALVRSLIAANKFGRPASE